jgi:hypothetical protein
MLHLARLRFGMLLHCTHIHMMEECRLNGPNYLINHSRWYSVNYLTVLYVTSLAQFKFDILPMNAVFGNLL